MAAGFPAPLFKQQTPKLKRNMKKKSARPALWPVASVTLCLLPATAGAAEETKTEPATLESMVVSALRVPQEASTVTSSVTLLDPQELQDQGLVQLRDALNASPGVISTSTGGQTGALGSLFIRGTRTADSQVVIDGVRLSDSNSPLGNLLASGRSYNFGSIEVLRGPQGAVYGGESIGGVLWLTTPTGSGKPSGSATVEGGSFDTFSGNAFYQGQVNDLSFYLAGGYEETSNEGSTPQDFHMGSTALRLEGKASDIWSVGSTFRSADSFYQNSGGFGTTTGSDDHFDSILTTLYANGRISDTWTARFLAGYHADRYDSDYLDFTGAPASYGTDLEAFNLSTDHEITVSEKLRLLAGAFYHGDDYSVIGGVDESGTRYGAHAAAEWQPVEHLTTTAALRWEDYDSFGSETTWRVGSVYQFESTGTALRAGVGKSFRAPSYTDLFYNTSWYVGNPDLEAQTSVGWDLGVEQALGSHHTLEATWFRNDIKDAIESYYDPEGDFVYTATNLPGTTTTDGLEVGLRGDWLERTLNYRVAWTYLHQSLSGQPRNATTADLNWKPTEKILIGTGATALSSHSWGGNPIDGYTLFRLYGSYQLTDSVKLHARAENLFGENYQLANFNGSVVEGTGTGVYAGITVDW